MIKDYLIDNYGYNEPIFLNDLLVEGISENAVRQSVKRLVAVFWKDMIAEYIIFQRVEDYLEKVIWILL